MTGRSKSSAPSKRSPRSASPHGVIFALGFVAILTCLPAVGLPQTTQSPDSGRSRQGPQPPRDEIGAPLTPLGAQQKKDLIRANLERSKRDASELATLARQLHEELNKPNANSLSRESIYRLVKIEKLAKKIREETTGF